MAYDYAPFPYVAPPGLNAPETRHPVVIVGAGPIGLAMAVDLATHNVPTVVLDDNNVVSVGSRAICWAKRSLEIFDRLGVGQRMLDKGVTWKVGRLFHGDKEVYSFDLLPEDGHKYPAFINLQQYYVEQYLVERAQDFPDLIDLRFLNKVIGHEDRGDHVVIDIETPDGVYQLETEYYLACEGAGSDTRRRMGLSFEGQTFQEQFLIADVEMESSPFGDDDVPERWFWFDPKFHNGKSALLHQQPDNIYRIDLQLDVGADAKEESREENVLPRLRAILGDRPFRLDWVSVYKFRCIRLDKFIHDRVIFVGDSAHVVSPFGARGGNGGIQDVDNLGWKLAAVLQGTAGNSLLASYDEERTYGSEENILNSARATNFMTPKTEIEALFRQQTLNLAKSHPFARKLINSGRLSTPCSLATKSLQSDAPAPVRPGSAAVDAPLGDGWLLSVVQGDFTLVAFDAPLPPLPDAIRGITVGQKDQGTDLALKRYGAGWSYLFRPDGHVCAAWDTPPDTEQLRAAHLRALGN